ncbi:MAG: hypothetical protein D6732_21705 [Methanobacteriota archaeon]|nr:MAG: hypothetical protein D6732_21705 [Euryarchaeota archaeon]
MVSPDSLESRLRAKLASGEISAEEFEELFERFKELGLLESDERKLNSLIVTGRKSYDEDLVVEGPVTVAGILRISGDLECQRLGIAGSGNITGEVRVNGRCAINGKLDVGKDIKVKGECTITGKCFASNAMYCIDRLTVAGKLIAPEKLVVGNRLKILGKVTVGSVECASSILVQGSLKSAGNVIAEKLVSPRGGNSSIGGNLIAKEVQVGRVQKSSDELGEIVGRLLTSLIGLKTETMFHIKGSIKAKKIQANNIRINGDIVADVIQLGDNVEVRGNIYYTQSIEASQHLKEKAERIVAEE